jgi:pyridoxine 4-dehydrogenase
MVSVGTGSFTALDNDAFGMISAESRMRAIEMIQPVDDLVLIPGTSSIAHLRENLAAGQLTLSPQVLVELNGIAAASVGAER